MRIHRIKKSYPAWAHGGRGSMAAIQKAERIARHLLSPEGAQQYIEYLKQHPDQIGGGNSNSLSFLEKGSPTPSDVHVNQPLTNISIAYLQELGGFVADRVFPIIPVTKQSDRYYEYTMDDWFRSQAQDRAPASESAGGGYEITNDKTYFAKPKAVHKDVDDQLRANADSILDLDRDATEFVSRQLIIKREKDWAASFFKTGVWTGSTTGTDISVAIPWNSAGSTPFEDLDAEITSIHQKTGYKPNTLVLGKRAWKKGLKHHPELLDRIKGGATTDKPASVKLQQLAAELELDQVMVADGIENTAARGASKVMAYILDPDDVFLCYSNPRPSLLTPSAGYCFSWTGYLGAGPAGNRMSRFRMQHLKADRIEGEMAFDMKVIGADLGAFLNEVVT